MGDGLLTVGIEQTPNAECFAELFKGTVEIPNTLWTHCAAVDLVLTLRRVYRQPSAHHDTHPVFRTERERPCAPHHRPDLGVGILQGEVPMSRRVLLEIGNLPGYQHVADTLLEEPLNRIRQFADANSLVAHRNKDRHSQHPVHLLYGRIWIRRASPC